jgi:hypothetical protein
MAEAVYILCALTCAAVAGLLLRGYRRSKTRLLLWSGLCFIGLTLNNVVLYFDMIVTAANVSLLFWRNLLNLASMAFLLYGLIWDSE